MPFEDFNTYTEVDPSSRFTISGDGEKITNVGLTSNETAYIYKDYGVDFFDGGYEHDFEVNATFVSTSALHMVHTLANTVDTFNSGAFQADAFGVAVFTSIGGTILRLRLYENDGTSSSNVEQTGLSFGTSYYCTFRYDLGVGTYGTLYLDIYSDSSRTTLISTLSRTVRSSIKKHRYVYGIQGWDSGASPAMSSFVNQLNLNLDIAVFRRRMEGY